jgi:hypothetical protein
MVRSSRGRSPRRTSWRPRPKIGGCLLWVLGILVILVILSLLFGGFQKGTKVGGARVLVPHSVTTTSRAGGGR